MSEEFLNKLKEISEMMEESDRQDRALEEQVWNSLSYDDKLNVFCHVMRLVSKAELQEKRSYRGVLYDTFGFGKESYVRGMNCGFMSLHNAMYIEEADKTGAQTTT